MIDSLYRRPWSVYLLLGAFALWGVISGFQLSVSLFPPANQSMSYARLDIGSQSSEQFFLSTGKDLESALMSLKVDNVPVTLLEANYGDSGVTYKIVFDWGADPQETKKAVEAKIISMISNLEPNVRDSLNVGTYGQNQGFFALSFYSPLRSLDELHQMINPLLTPIKGKVEDASSLSLYNPGQKEITIELNPQRMAQVGLLPSHVENALRSSTLEFNGGSLKLGENAYQLTLPRMAKAVSDLERIRVSDPMSAPVFLKDVAQLKVNVSSESKQRFKTSGVESLILFGSPKEGGNIKRMSDQIVAEVGKIRSQLPEDVKIEVLVNPADYINRSILGVIKEVALAAFLAVTVLFIFIGNFRNVITAAIEIPLSLLMALILMKLTGMNLNLISLGGLALSAGMNVDASVVVLENIFRHFEGKPKNLSFNEKAKIISGAVNEVKIPIIASTIASLVVFLPLVFTHGLASSLLGDLAKAVIFSHGISAIVALVLVPTVRLHLLKNGELSHEASVFESFIRKLEQAYQRLLTQFLLRPKVQLFSLALVLGSLALLITFAAPKLKREIIGQPASDWLIVGLHSPLLNQAKQVEAELDSLNASLMEKFGQETLYTFSQSWENGGSIMLRLKDKRKIAEIEKKAQELYKPQADKSYWVSTWNPSEFRIPDPPLLRVNIVGGTNEKRLEVAQDLNNRFLEDPDIGGMSGNFPAGIERDISVTPITNLGTQPDVLPRYEFSHILRTALSGIYVSQFSDGASDYPIYLRLPEVTRGSLEALKALPVGYEGRLIPLGALAKFEIQTKNPKTYRENEQSLFKLWYSANEERNKNWPVLEEKIHKVVQDTQSRLNERASQDKNKADWPVVQIAEQDLEVSTAFDQLKWAIAASVLLILLTMVLQTGDLVTSLIILTAIPFGFIGVIAALFVFNSTISLNSGLGTILLNGIAVANSIILVDFIRRLTKEGLDPLNATVTASTARLRPILMTTLTTVLGMLPIAIGFGDSGKTLQPLGIAVSGGLWISTLFTLIFVPTLQLHYLRWQNKRKPAAPVQGQVA